MNISSRSTVKNVLLVVSTGCLLVAIIWIGMNVFRPADIMEAPSPRKSVSFDSSVDIRKNPLFETLQSYFDWSPQASGGGNPFPFVGSDLGGHEGQSLANVPAPALLSIVSAHGGVLKDISETSDGTMLGLWFVPGQGSDSAGYEIRSYRSATATHDVISAWKTDASPNETIAALAISPNGDMRILNAAGDVGTVQEGSSVSPEWFGVQTGLPEAVSRVYIDQADRMWVTDGKRVSLGGKQGFAPVDLVSQLGANARVSLLTKLTQGMLSPLANQDAENALLQAELQPKDFFSLHAGKTGLTTKSGVFFFPLSTFLKPEWIDSLNAGLVPLAIAPNEDVWEVRPSDSALIQRSSSTMHTFASLTAAPRGVRTNGSLFAFYGNRVYAFDYAPTSTFVWYDDGDGWTAQSVSTTERLPVGTPSKILIDRNGSLWAMLSNGELLRVEPGK